jgi:hypothetical protein
MAINVERVKAEILKRAGTEDVPYDVDQFANDPEIRKELGIVPGSITYDAIQGIISEASAIVQEPKPGDKDPKYLIRRYENDQS